MNHRHQLGLVVGKFSPLHHGHEHVIRTAQACCERVLVLGYSQPLFKGCERARRQAWVAQRFPDVINIQLDGDEVERLARSRGIASRPIPPNHAPDAEQQAYLAWLLHALLGLHPDAMLGSEHYVAPSAALLSQRFGHEVTPICVDLARTAYPISASRIRADVHAHRHWLDPLVYQDFVPRIVLLGGESTGKTTLAQAMATQHDTVWVPEYGRERWLQQGGQLSLADLIDIGRTQISHEAALHRQARRYLFCDTSPLTTLGYAGWMFQAQPPELQAMALRPYDLAVLCEPDFAFVQDGTRQDETFRQRQHDWYVQQLTHRGQAWLSVRGD
jgi:HTH-type transcriptional repressor of NAD biosynthesis genes